MLNRRLVLQLGTVGVLAAGLPTARSAARSGFRAIAFDGFAIFDPRPVAALTESLFPGNGTAIINAWRTRQFEYQWLHAISGHYADFLQATDESLAFAFKQLQLELSEENRQRLMAPYANLQVWPDVADAIKELRESGLRLAVVSNMTASMLRAGLEKAGLAEHFEAVLSTDQIRSYKPDPRAYQLALDALRLQCEQILFVAFAGWDVAGAKWFGYPTFWVNRLGAPMEVLGVAPDASGADMRSLISFTTL